MSQEPDQTGPGPPPPRPGADGADADKKEDQEEKPEHYQKDDKRVAAQVGGVANHQKENDPHNQNDPHGPGAEASPPFRWR